MLLMTILAIRESRGLTCEQAALLANVHFTTWARWERNGLPAARVLEVEKATGIPRQQLRPDMYGEADCQTPAIAKDAA